MSTQTKYANDLCAGRTVAAVDIDEGDNISIKFSDGGTVVFSTLGGIDVRPMLSQEVPR